MAVSVREENVEEVLQLLEDGLGYCVQHSQSSNYDNLFYATVKLCSCLLVVSAMVSLSDEETLQPVWFGMFNILSSLFNIFEDRLSDIQQRGAAAVCNGRGRPLIMVDIAQVERLVVGVVCVKMVFIWKDSR